MLIANSLTMRRRGNKEVIIPDSCGLPASQTSEVLWLAVASLRATQKTKTKSRKHVSKNDTENLSKI